MNTEEEILASRARKKEFAKKVAAYIEEHEDFDALDKTQLVEVAIYAMTQDIGLAHDFLKVIGVDVDLYSYNFAKKTPVFSTICREVPFYELTGRGLEFQPFMRRYLESFGFDFSRPISWMDDMDREVRIYTQDEVSNVDSAGELTTQEILTCYFKKDDILGQPGPIQNLFAEVKNWIERELVAAGFDLNNPVQKEFNLNDNLWVYTQRKHEVSNADRAKGAPEGSYQVSEQREDPIRWGW